MIVVKISNNQQWGQHINAHANARAHTHKLVIPAKQNIHNPYTCNQGWYVYWQIRIRSLPNNLGSIQCTQYLHQHFLNDSIILFATVCTYAYSQIGDHPCFCVPLQSKYGVMYLHHRLGGITNARARTHAHTHTHKNRWQEQLHNQKQDLDLDQDQDQAQDWD